MFCVNEKVIYGNTGLCTITEIREISLDGEPKKYYILTPAKGKGTVYVPVDGGNEKLRKPISKKEATRLIEKIPELESVWIDNDIMRKAAFGAIVKKADPEELMKLIKSLSMNEKKRKAQNKKIHVNDEKVMNDACRVLFTELSVAQELMPEEVEKQITEILEKL